MLQLIAVADVFWKMRQPDAIATVEVLKLNAAPDALWQMLQVGATAEIEVSKLSAGTDAEQRGGCHWVSLAEVNEGCTWHLNDCSATTSPPVTF